MQISTETILKLNPCQSRLQNYLNYYKNFNGSFDEFLELENISYEDKIWVAGRILYKNQLVHFSLLCAKSVLSIFEEKNPEDKRVRECIEFLNKIEDFSNLTQQQKSELLKVRRSVANAAAYAATDAAYAANAAANAANAAYHAVAYAADAAAAYYASNASNAACAAAYYAVHYAAAADARKQQQELNLQFLKMAANL